MARRREVATAALVFLLGCSVSPQTPAIVPPPDGLDIVSNTHVEEAARFLAGLPGPDAGAFHDAELQPEWNGHRQQMDDLWDKTAAHRLPAMERFQQTELSGPPYDSGTLFYPFGGPDVITATRLFPEANRYLLIGLEPPGTLPNEPAEVTARLDRMRIALGSVIRASFFITSEMTRDLRGRAADGVLPVMLVLLARTGHEIHGAVPVAIDDEGDLIEREGPVQRNAGVAIEFSRPGDPARRRIYYFSADLSTKVLRDNEPLLRYLDKLGPVRTLLKAASYLPHNRGFDLVRDRVLRQSVAIVQDDTGIPYRFFRSPQWQVALYGNYSHPIPVFRRMLQPDLLRAYQDAPDKPLGFHIGYGSGKKPSNLLVARRSQ